MSFPFPKDYESFEQAFAGYFPATEPLIDSAVADTVPVSAGADTAPAAMYRLPLLDRLYRISCDDILYADNGSESEPESDSDSDSEQESEQDSGPMQTFNDGLFELGPYYAVNQYIDVIFYNLPTREPIENIVTDLVIEMCEGLAPEMTLMGVISHLFHHHSDIIDHLNALCEFIYHRYGIHGVITNRDLVMNYDLRSVSEAGTALYGANRVSDDDIDMDNDISDAIDSATDADVQFVSNLFRRRHEPILEEFTGVPAAPVSHLLPAAPLNPFSLRVVPIEDAHNFFRRRSGRARGQMQGLVPTCSRLPPFESDSESDSDSDFDSKSDSDVESDSDSDVDMMDM
jgi:hypothetical protein